MVAFNAISPFISDSMKIFTVFCFAITIVSFISSRARAHNAAFCSPLAGDDDADSRRQDELPRRLHRQHAQRSRPLRRDTPPAADIMRRRPVDISAIAAAAGVVSRAGHHRRRRRSGTQF